MSDNTYILLKSVIAQGAGPSVQNPTFSSPIAARTFQANGTVSTSTGAATVVVQVSNNNSDWITLGTITLTLGTSSTSDGFAALAPWAYVRGNVTAISGTNATVSLVMAL
jgi:hypothetical protein